MALTASALSLAIGVDAATADRLLPVAIALASKYAPAAPEAVAEEAQIRIAGWLAEQPAASVRSESVGDISTAFAPGMASAMLNSGAKALLAPWRVRRAGAVG